MGLIHLSKGCQVEVQYSRVSVSFFKHGLIHRLINIGAEGLWFSLTLPSIKMKRNLFLLIVQNVNDPVLLLYCRWENAKTKSSTSKAESR